MKKYDSLPSKINRQVFDFAERDFAIWRVLLGSDAKTASPATLKQRLVALRQDAGFWAIILNRGGHFAAAIFSHIPAKPDSKAGKGPATQPFQEITHKTFHRYVVR